MVVGKVNGGGEGEWWWGRCEWGGECVNGGGEGVNGGDISGGIGRCKWWYWKV